MGIADLKQRMRDVPGIESLTMTMQGGQQIYAVAGHNVSFDAAAPDSQVEAGIRAAVASPALVQMAAGGPVDTAAAAVALHPSISASLLPQVKPMADTPAAPSSPAAHALTMKGALDNHSQKLDAILQASIATLQTVLDDQLNTVQGGTSAVIAGVKAKTDDFKAILGQFSNKIEGL